MGFALLALLLLQRYAMGLALRPLERARQQIAQLQQGQRQQLDQQAPVELQPLVEQINHLLSHTEETLQRSRHALGNLGHALKTPLAVLGSLVQREELAAHPELRASLLEQLEQIQQRVSRELGRARLSVDVLPGAHFDCDAELPALFDTGDDSPLRPRSCAGMPRLAAVCRVIAKTCSSCWETCWTTPANGRAAASS